MEFPANLANPASEIPQEFHLSTPIARDAHSANGNPCAIRSSAPPQLSCVAKSSVLAYTDFSYYCSKVSVHATSIHMPDDRCLCQSWAVCCSQSGSLVWVLGQIKDFRIRKGMAETFQARSRRLRQGLATCIVCDQKVSCRQENMSHVALHLICKSVDLHRHLYIGQMSTSLLR